MPPKEGFAPEAVGAIGLLVHRLARAGAGGVVLGRQGTHKPFIDVPFEAVRPGLGLSNAARYAAGVARAVQRLGAKLVEVHNWPEVAWRLRGAAPTVSLILNNDPQNMRAARTAAQRGALLRGLAGIATSSAWLRERFLEAVEDERDVTVLPNCIDVPPAPPVEREKLILFAGRVVSDKGADAFVAACGAVLPGLPGWRAELIGADRFRPDSPETPFVRTLRPAAAAARVAMLGHQPNDQVLAAMRRAAIVVVPSRWAEPFGLVALEAMAEGAALVCSGRGGLREVAGDAAVYADPDAPGALADAIAALARDERRRAALALKGRSRAETFGAPAAAVRLLAWRATLLA